MDQISPTRSFLDAFFGQVGFLLFKRNWMVLRLTKRGGAEEARWAHNPKVIGSKPILATAHSFAAPPTLLPNLYPLVKCEMWSSQSTPAATAVKWGDACMMFIANKAVALFVGALFLEQNRTTASRLVLRDPAENMWTEQYSRFEVRWSKQHGSSCFKFGNKFAESRYGHTLKFTPHPIPNCEVKLDGPVQYWGGGPPGKFVVLYLLFPFLLSCLH
jgi:hypothetical protein